MTKLKDLSIKARVLISFSLVVLLFIFAEFNTFTKMLDPQNIWDFEEASALIGLLFALLVIKITYDSISKTTERFARKEQTLDSVSSQVMIADKDYNIIYLNPELQKMLTEAEEDIKKDADFLPQLIIVCTAFIIVE